MERVTLYGAEFDPVPFGIPAIPATSLRLPSGAGNAIRIACTVQGHLGSVPEVEKFADDSRLDYQHIGWVFPVMGAVFTKRLWYEWALLDGTLSRTLEHDQARPESFEAACAELLSAYQEPTRFGLQLDLDGNRLARAS